MLELDRVTLCCIDCVNHELALAALGQCVQKARFGRVLFLTDREFDLEGVDAVRIAPLASRDAYSQFVVKELHRYVETDFVLLIQWDGFVINSDAWSDAFFDYDYIGAKWGWYDDDHRVGNGGFSLRSKRLLAALTDPQVAEFPLEDVAICRTYRPYLESMHGIRYAPETLADRFSFEASYFSSWPFGFHGLFNFWLFFRKPELSAFLDMAPPAILGSVQCLQLAKNYAEAGRAEEARMVLQKIVAAHPAHAEAAALLADAATPKTEQKAVGRNTLCPCGSGKRYKECHGRVGSPPAAAPGAVPVALSVAAILQRALAAHRAGDLYTAEALYNQVLRVDARHAVALHYLGVIAYQRLRFEEARGLLERALVGNEQSPDYHNNVGLVLHKLGELPHAIECFQHAIALNANYVEAYNNLGLALQDEHRYDDARAAFDRALELRPEFADARWNRALLLLLRGDYATGWREYEWRLRHPQLGLAHGATYAGTRWDGSDPAGKRLLVYTEQGYGDALQFIRYVPLVRERGAQVIVEAQPALCRLFSSLSDVTVVPRGEPLPEYDFHLPLLSLPLACATRLENIPAAPAYLHARAEDSATWRERLAHDRAFRMGIVWAGNIGNNPGRHRACPPESFGALRVLEGVSFYSVQKDKPSGQAAPPLFLHDHTAEFTDFAATAALIVNLDLVLTIDTAVAHLAGALGKPVWVLLPYERDWRWLEEGEASPWYPSMCLLQQTQRGDWDELFARVVPRLASLVASNRTRLAL